MKIEKIYYWLSWFKETLSAAEQAKLNPDLITVLRHSQLSLWRALNIYDDFLDGEGEPAKLPLANRHYRYFLKTYYQLGLTSDFNKLFEKVMTSLDNDNQREAEQMKLKIKKGELIMPKKLPHFHQLTSLSRKSLALALGPIALLNILGYRTKDPKIQTTLRFFKYALAAKQLADDAHDWREDLQAGKITAANVLLLQTAKKNKINLNLKRRPEIAYLLFSLGAPELTSNLNKLCAQARQTAKKLKWPADAKLIKQIIVPLENGAREASEFQKLLT